MEEICHVFGGALSICTPKFWIDGFEASISLHNEAPSEQNR